MNEKNDMKEQVRILKELKSIDKSLKSLTEAFEELKKEGELTDEDIQIIIDEFESFSTGKEGKMVDIRNDLRRIYERYYSKFADNAIVPVNNGVCSGCFLQIPPMRLDRIHAGEEIIYCENCGRILIWEEGVSE